jgi:DNA-binding NtrC family response regulator
MTLPRVLVLDDLTAWSPEDRRLMCRDLALVDVTNDDKVVGETSYLAEAVFHPGQTRLGNEIKNDIEAVLRLVGEGWDGEPEHRWALVLLDLQFDHGEVKDGPLNPDRNWPRHADRDFGLRILQALAERWPDSEMPGRTEIPVVALSTSPRAKLEDRLNNLGNLGYLERERDGEPVPANGLRQQFATHLFHFGLVEDGPLATVDDEGRITRTSRREGIIGESLPLLRSLRAARRAANAPGYCLLLGPIGAGKELFAKFIHDLSSRSAGPYVAINCAGIPETLIESELFGHEKGAFTDAKNRKLGSFEQADKGTLFLDEIGYMSPGAQTRLLRVLEGGQINRLGGTAAITVDVKVIAATNQNLQVAVEEKRFTGDLLSRIKHYEIRIPSLSERSSDIDLLFDYFLEKETANIKDAIWPKRIDAQVYETLKSRLWDESNVRQLRKTVARIASDRRFSQSITPNDILPEDSTEASPHVTQAVDEGKAPSQVTESLSDVESVLREAHITRSRSDLSGRLSSLQEAYGSLVMRLLEIALAETKAVGGEIKPTTAIKLLLGREQMSAAEAASYLLTLSKQFPMNPAKDSDLMNAVTWAVTRRRSGPRTQVNNENGK